MAMPIGPLTDRPSRVRPAPAELPLLIERVAKVYCVTVEALQGRRLTADICEARHVAMWVAYNGTDATLVAIGQALGGRDHSTVFSGIERIERQLHHDRELAETICELAS